MVKKTSTKKEGETKKTVSLSAPVYDRKGQAVEQIDLPAEVFGLAWNADLVHQVVTSLMTNRRVNLAHTKNRAEVSGGGKKPWQQKGLGRARHGSTRSPIWIKGGVAHGPRNERNYERKVNSKMKTKALFTILSRKFQEGEVLFVDHLKLALPKTKEAISYLGQISAIKGFEKISQKKNNTACIVVAKRDENSKRGFQNLGQIKFDETRNLNPLDLLRYKFLVMADPKEAVQLLIAKIK